MVLGFGRITKKSLLGATFGIMVWATGSYAETTTAPTPAPAPAAAAATKASSQSASEPGSPSTGATPTSSGSGLTSAPSSTVPASAPTSAPNSAPASNVNANANTTTDQKKGDVQVSQVEKQKALQDFVKQAASYIKENGKETALAEFNKTDGAFTKDTLYVFAIDYEGNELATMNQKILGTNQLNYKDPDGVSVVQRLIEKAKSGGGWFRYKWENPVSKVVECKNSYVMPANISGSSDYLIGAGYFYPISPATGKCEEEK